MKRWTKQITIALVAMLVAMALGSATTANAQGGGNTPRLVRQVGMALVNETAKALNLKPADVMKELNQGVSIADVIKAHNGDAAVVKTAVKKTVTDRTAEAVKNGKLTQEQADKMLADLDANLETAMSAKWPAGQTRSERLIDDTAITIAVQQTAKATSLSQRDLLTEVRAGKTLADIAKAHNADVDKIITASVDEATTRINQLVKNNRIKQEEATTLIAGLKTTFTDLMNKQNPLAGMLPLAGRNGGKPGKGQDNPANPGNPGNPGNPAATPAATPAA